MDYSVGGGHFFDSHEYDNGPRPEATLPAPSPPKQQGRRTRAVSKSPLRPGVASPITKRQGPRTSSPAGKLAPRQLLPSSLDASSASSADPKPSTSIQGCSQRYSPHPKQHTAATVPVPVLLDPLHADEEVPFPEVSAHTTPLHRYYCTAFLEPAWPLCNSCKSSPHVLLYSSRICAHSHLRKPVPPGAWRLCASFHLSLVRMGLLS